MHELTDGAGSHFTTAKRLPGPYRAFYGVVVVVAATLRLVALPQAGAIYQDDLRAYSGVALVHSLSDSGSVKHRMSAAYWTSITKSGARPALAWLAAIPASFGAKRIGVLYLPFAILGTVAVPMLIVLLRRMSSDSTAGFAGLYLAVAPAAVNYSRSALSPMPAIVLMLAGLIALDMRPRVSSLPSPRRAVLCGAAFAFAVAFHPAYILYLCVPALFLATWPSGEPLSENWRRRCLLGVLFVLPTPALVLAYDLPNVASHVSTGVSRLDFVYLTALSTLEHDPSVHGAHEGVLFWPRYLLASHGYIGATLLLGLIVVAMLRGRRSAPHASERLLIWAIAPWALWCAWLSVNSYARLYAPLLLPVAGLVGLGAAASARWSQTRFRSIPKWLPAGAIGLTIGLSNLLLSSNLIRSQGPEPALAEWANSRQMRGEIANVALGFERTDAAALTPIRLVSVFTQSDVRDAFCSGRARQLILSPGALYLAIRHERFLATDLSLQPIWTVPSPFRVAPLRLYEGQSAEERRRVLQEPLYREMGLYRITGITPHC